VTGIIGGLRAVCVWQDIFSSSFSSNFQEILLLALTLRCVHALRLAGNSA